MELQNHFRSDDIQNIRLIFEGPFYLLFGNKIALSGEHRQQPEFGFKP